MKTADQDPANRIPAESMPLSRRNFIMGSGLAALGVSLVPLSSLLLGSNDAHGKSFSVLGAAAGKTLQRMARDIFPHDKLPDKYYLQAVAPYDASAAKDPKLRKLLGDGVDALDQAARQRYGKAYAEVPKEEDRLDLLKQIEPTPFFQKLRGDLVTGLYNNKAVWPLLGYEGSSWEKGGYLQRGFNDINWL